MANFVFYFAGISAGKDRGMSSSVQFLKRMANIAKCKYVFKSSVDNIFISIHEASSFLHSTYYTESLPFLITSAKYNIYLAFLKEPWLNVIQRYFINV